MHTMRQDAFGRVILSEDDLCSLYMQDPARVVTNALTECEISLPPSLQLQTQLQTALYQVEDKTIEEFDSLHNTTWFIPEKYKTFDIAKFALDQCKSEVELQRVGDELLKFQERDLFPLLRYLKYLVDTMRKNNIVWGVGRGSSVSSYVLFLIGVHKIDSIFYDLSIDEFLK